LQLQHGPTALRFGRRRGRAAPQPSAPGWARCFAVYTRAAIQPTGCSRGNTGRHLSS
jgi:hypothetical protein